MSATSRGPAAPSGAQNHLPPGTVQDLGAAGPREVEFHTYGLRPSDDGYEVVRVAHPSGEVKVLRDAEPFMAIAYEYASIEIANEYLLKRQG